MIKKPQGVRIASTISPEIREELEKIVEERQSTLGQVIRSAIAFYLKHKENNEY